MRHHVTIDGAQPAPRRIFIPAAMATAILGTLALGACSGQPSDQMSPGYGGTRSPMLLEHAGGGSDYPYRRVRHGRSQ